MYPVKILWAGLFARKSPTSERAESATEIVSALEPVIRVYDDPSVRSRDVRTKATRDKEIGQDRSRPLGLGPKGVLGCVVGPEFAPAMPCGLRLAWPILATNAAAL